MAGAGAGQCAARAAAPRAALRLFAPFLPARIDPIVTKNVVDALFHPDGVRRFVVNWDALEQRLFTTITTLGTPVDVSAQELRIEAYYPAGVASEEWLTAPAAD